MRSSKLDSACATLLSAPSIKVLLVTALLSSWLKLGYGLLPDLFSMPVGVILKEGQVFDYIVVGAGAAGAAAAARLSLAGSSVLLVEAGGNPTYFSRIPSLSLGLLGSEMDWQYETIPNNVSCLSAEGRQCRFSRGRCLGGSTSINYMLYTRGNRRDFDDITVPGWTWDDLKPYFLKYENLQELDLLPPSSKPYHNTTGNMHIGFFSDSNNLWRSRLIGSFKSLGFPENPDVNAESQIGVSQVIGYVHGGERMSTARAYLGRKDVKKTLKVAKNTLCTGVIIDEKKVARGVSVIQGSRKLNIYSKREVILSAGAIGTPHILMLSGVGPAEHLKNIGIQVKVDLPSVGANMTDHVLPLVFAQVDKNTGIKDSLFRLITSTADVTKLLLGNRGPLTSNGITDVSAFVNTYCYDFEQRKLHNKSSDGSDCEVPNLQIINAHLPKGLLALVKTMFRHIISFNEEVVDQISKANENNGFILISPVLLNQHSLGRVRLASADPTVHPAIFPNYLDDERDVDTIVRSIRIVEHLMDTIPFREQNATLLHFKLPGCPSVDEDRVGYWSCYTRHMTFAVYHSAGTSALGHVVDSRLRVIGVQRLRVADLGVLPRPPRGTTAAVTIAIGERVSDFVLEDNQQFKEESCVLR